MAAGSALSFLRLTDAHDGRLSLTSLLGWVAVGRSAAAPAIGIAEVLLALVFLVAMVAKRAERWATRAPSAIETDLEAQRQELAELRARTEELGLQVGWDFEKKAVTHGR